MMHIPTDKKQKDKNESVAELASQSKQGTKSTFQFVDNRPEAFSQHKKEISNNRPQARIAASLPAMATNRIAQQQPFQQKTKEGFDQSKDNTGLFNNLKSGTENPSSHSTDEVRSLNIIDTPSQLQVPAYVPHTNIHLGTRQEKHLTGKPWHLAQEKQKSVMPIVQMKREAGTRKDSRLVKEMDMVTGNTPYFADNRPKSFVQKQLWTPGHNYSQARQLKPAQGIINHYPPPLKVALIKTDDAIAAKRSNAPVQAVKFSRVLSTFSYNDDEEKLLAEESEVENFLSQMQTYEPRFPEIRDLQATLNQIKNATIDSKDYQNTKHQLDSIKQALDNISIKIALVGEKGGNDMMNAFGTSAEDSNVGKIIKIYLDTISILPAVMKTDGNRVAIKDAIHPDASNNAIGYTEQYLGESDVALAQKRHQQLVTNLFALNDRVQNDWNDLQAKFGLEGGIKEISLTGSDLHKGGQQVVIIESEGGQKIVYKPRSTAPDAALMDSQTGIFKLLNDKGAQLPTLGFHASKDKGSYVQFVHQQKLKTHEQIKQYYNQMGMLAAAAKLFGVNDLHYENIMASAHGPAIIDGETSFLLNVMTARDFRSNELQKGIFEHVSEIDQKLSNNSFYTAQEKTDWENLPSAGKAGWDQYIGNIRDQDVKADGLYEADLNAGIQQMLDIVKRNREEIIGETVKRIKNTDSIRVVPVATTLFKQLMAAYRDHKRNDNEHGLEGTLENACESVIDALNRKGYTVYDPSLVKVQLQNDFNGGDIPILHYNGRSNHLTWDDQVIAEREDYDGSEDVVSENVKWVLTQTVNDITGSLQS